MIRLLRLPTAIAEILLLQGRRAALRAGLQGLLKHGECHSLIPQPVPEVHEIVEKRLRASARDYPDRKFLLIGWQLIIR